MAARDLFLVRHGETEWSRNGRHTSLTDLSLLADGRRRAELLGRRLAGERFDAAFTSPLQRARETAAAAGFPDASVEPLLSEWDYGEYEGLTTAQIHESRPDWNLWRDGCPGGESPAAVLDRARRCLERVFELPDARAVIAFSHGHFSRALAIAFLDWPAATGAGLALDTAAISVLRRSDGGRLLQLWNSLEHLPGELRS